MRVDKTEMLSFRKTVAKTVNKAWRLCFESPCTHESLLSPSKTQFSKVSKYLYFSCNKTNEMH